jgi:hypothetical protein
MFTKQALGAFLAGGVLVGGVAFAGVAHGASTDAGTTSTGQTDSQYMAKHAWQQSYTGTGNVALSIPSGQRLTVTAAVTSTGENISECTVNVTVNGAPASINVWTQADGTGPGVWQTIYADSGKISCSNLTSGQSVTLVGYLTSIPA